MRCKIDFSSKHYIASNRDIYLGHCEDFSFSLRLDNKRFGRSADIIVIKNP